RDHAAVHREFLDPAAIEKSAGRRVQSLRVLTDDDEVDFAGLPDLLEARMDLVPHIRVELRRSDVRVEVQSEAEAEHHADARDDLSTEAEAGPTPPDGYDASPPQGSPPEPGDGLCAIAVVVSRWHD